jgi:hypothetical protein
MAACYLRVALLAALVLTLGSTPARADGAVFQFSEDFGLESESDCALQYYYYIPCPTHSWFYALWGPPGGGMWEDGDVIGKWFKVGDSPTGGFAACDPTDCQAIGMIRFLDLASYGSSAYPHLVLFKIYCSDEYGCPTGPSIWESDPRAPAYGWNHISIDPPVSVCPCITDPGPPPTGPRVLVTATHVLEYEPAAHDMTYFGADIISAPLSEGCDMHDEGCLEALYPRPQNSHYATIHSGYYGENMAYCPPVWIKDVDDTTPDASQYGYVEWAWTIYLMCNGPSQVQPATWGSIKSMYR